MSQDESKNQLNRLLNILLLAVLSQLVVSQDLAAQQGKPMVINQNGAWCWFQDERAVIANGVHTEKGLAAVRSSMQKRIDAHDKEMAKFTKAPPASVHRR